MQITSPFFAPYRQKKEDFFMSEKKVGKRLLTWVLVLVMTLSLLPLNVLADASDNVKYGTIGEDGKWTETENGTGTNNSTGITGVKSVSKTAKPATDEYGKIISNQYDVTLKVELEQTTSTTPPGAAATVLVMDHSGSMNGYASCNSWQSPFGNAYYHAEDCKYKQDQYYTEVEDSQSRMAAATQAVKSFIKTYSGRFDENGKETTTENLNLGRWVCLVWFNKTGGVVGSHGWLDVSNKDAYDTAINTNGWKAQEGTNLDCGLKLANNQLQQDAVKNIGKSLKDVVVLTDGQPTYYLRNLRWHEFSADIEIGGTKYKVEHDGKSCDEDTFRNTKDSATNLKQNASVYTVCFGASEEKITNYDDQTGDEIWVGPTYSEIAVGDYLKTKIATPQTGDKTYAYDASNTDGLMSAFAAITKDIVSGLNSGTVTDRLPAGVTFKNGTPDGFTSTSENGAYKWELSGATGTEENNNTVYTYTTTYTVTIDPETAVADEDSYVPLNGKTTLTVDGGGSVDFPIPAGKVTLPTYKVTYSWTGLPEGATADIPTDNTEYYAGDTVTIDPTYTDKSTVKVGHDTYTFSGWTTISPALNEGKMPASPVTASGTWTKTATDTFTVTWVNWNGDLLEKDEDVKYNSDPSYDGKSPTRPASGRYTYTFNGWTPALSPVTGDITYTATYKSTYHPSTPSKPTVVIPDDDALGLNTTDHFAYIVGYGNGEVRPQNNITRAEVATIFFRLLTDDVRDENLTKTNRYSDVAATSWYNTAVSTLSSMGIITGYPDGTFRPNAAITRAEFAAIAARFDHDGDKTAAKFSDIANHWAKDEISIAYNNGWITGYPDGTFGPQRDITRAETMTLVNRVLNRQPETEEDLLPNMTVWTDNANPKAWYYLAVQEATNSHYYKFKTNSKYEKWTELRETRDWTQLEK